MPLFGALQAGIRQYDLCCEVKAYLAPHPRACVVNLGCGLDTTFSQTDNGMAFGYNLDFPDVIEVRNQLLSPGEREKNVPCDLTDLSWFDEIAFRPEEGIVFVAGGVFYYFLKEQVQTILCAMAARFPGGRIAFDATTPLGIWLMSRTWLKAAKIDQVGTYFSVKKGEAEIAGWCREFKSVRRKKYMAGYRPLDKRWSPLTRGIFRLYDRSHLAQIIQIEFR